MPSDAFSFGRFIPPNRLRIVGLDELTPGELFITGSCRGSPRLAVLFRATTAADSPRFLVGLSDEAGKLTSPDYHRLEVGDTVGALGKEFDFLVDPLDARNEIHPIGVNHTKAGVGVIYGRLVVVAWPSPHSHLHSRLFVDVTSGLPLGQSASPGMFFAAWQLRLRSLDQHDSHIVLGEYSAPET